jgi:poly-gamma-glutamate capsule biosynthesis protein CapA/YwtB (metallophosphatase superfamily)
MIIGLCGDVMIGRTVNERATNLWGDTLPLFHETDLNLINLEAAITRHTVPVPKVFNFRADPEKVAWLQQARIDAVNLANNHILDFGEEGMRETLQVLDDAGIAHVGAGPNARDPAIIGNVGILGCTDNEPGWSPHSFFVEVGDIESLKEPIAALRPQVETLILSIHWGPNMRQRPAPRFQKFAHALCDLGVDIIHGHSAHIFQGVEAYNGSLILYDTGDFVDDYAIDPLLRNDQSFFFRVDTAKRELEMIPTVITGCQVNISQNGERMIALSRELGSEVVVEPVTGRLRCRF